jgi:small multidrug resistance pump
MSWLFLIVAIILEVAGTTFMKLSQGFTRLIPSFLVFILYGLSLGSLTLALKKIDVSVAYAVWSGIGTALIAGVGIVWFKEPAGAAKMISIGLIILGVIGLNLSGGIYSTR